MALKQWMKKFQPLSLYIVLTLTMFYFLLQLVVSNFTHALTLTIDSYLVLCNLIALFGCVITLKNTDNTVEDTSISTSTPSVSSNSDDSCKSNNSSSQCDINILTKVPVAEKCSSNTAVTTARKHNASERRLRNTFGWARIDVLVMLIGCVVFASLCFSLVIEAVQTLFHISHTDEMHCPIPVFCVGAFGLILNGLSYLLIGGCVFVMICSTVVYFADSVSAKLADPILAIISAVSLLLLSYPYIKESCLILLQTIPDHINIDCLCKQLMKEFPDIINVHDLHVWQFTKGKTFFTAHIIFLNPKVYASITQNITKFFHDQGITKVTIQPEFFKDSNCLELISSDEGNCLVKCMNPECYQRYCCDMHTLSAELKAVLISKSTINPGQVELCEKKTPLPSIEPPKENSHSTVNLENNSDNSITETENHSQTTEESGKNSQFNESTKDTTLQIQEDSHNQKIEEIQPKALTTEL